MKGNAKPSSVYFSAYPLKAVQKANSSTEASQSPYLRVMISNGRSKTTNRGRIFPMINPYKNPYGEQLLSTPVNKELSRVPEDIELTEKRWFHNYE